MDEIQLALKNITLHYVRYFPWATADPSRSIYWAGASVPPPGTGTPLAQVTFRGSLQTSYNFYLHSNNSILLIRMRHSTIQQL